MTVFMYVCVCVREGRAGGWSWRWVTAAWALGCVSAAGVHPRERGTVYLRARVCVKLSVGNTRSAAVASTRLSVTKSRGWTDSLSNTLLSLDEQTTQHWNDHLDWWHWTWGHLDSRWICAFQLDLERCVYLKHLAALIKMTVKCTKALLPPIFQ